MNCWTILGIERTADTSIIKKAYKQQLLIYHPEDDPEGYQRVRAAYNKAISEAKKQAVFTNTRTLQFDESTENNDNEHDEKSAETIEHNENDENLNIIRQHFGTPQYDSNEDTDENLEVTRRHFETNSQTNNHTNNHTNSHSRVQAEYDFMSRLVYLYRKERRRDDPEAWIELFEKSDVLWDVQSKAKIDEEMLKFFSSNYDLNDNIWVIIENHTGLFNKINKNSEQYPAYFVDRYILATQKLEVPRGWRSYNKLQRTIVERTKISWFNYCYGYFTPFSWIILFFVFNAAAIVILFLIALIRSIFFVRRRIWKIVMWEYHLSYINSWGIRHDFKYIDIIKVSYSPNITTIYLKNKKININNGDVHHIRKLLDKLSKYGIWHGNTLIVQVNAHN